MHPDLKPKYNQLVLTIVERTSWRPAMNNLLKLMQAGEKKHTNEFQEAYHGFFLGESNRSFLRKCLRTLVEDEYAACTEINRTSLLWNITEKGLAYLKTLPKPSKF